MDQEKTKGPKFEQLSETTADNANGDDFLIDICQIMNDNEEFQNLVEKPNFGRAVVTDQQKEIKEADNIFTIKHFIRDNIKAIRSSKELQLELKAKIERLKKLVKPEGTEFAQLFLLENQINDMLNEDIGDNDQ